MTIRKGDQWGEPCTAPTGLLEFATERELGRHLRDIGTIREAMLNSGTLIQALGVTTRAPNREQIKVTIDVIKIGLTDQYGVNRDDF